jgi:hypothetical protein
MTFSVRQTDFSIKRVKTSIKTNTSIHFDHPRLEKLSHRLFLPPKNMAFGASMENW